VDECVAQAHVGIGVRAEASYRPAGDPRIELAERARALGHSFAVALEPGPEELLGGDRCDELAQPSAGA